MAMNSAHTVEKIPFGQKAAFGAGHLVNNLLPGALGVFSFFLITAFGIEPAIAGLLSAIPRFFDALTDPIMGFISDNTTSRWGRRRPYIFMGAILSAILFVVQWQMFEENGSTYNFWYFLLFSILFIFANTIFSTPLIGFGYEMSSDTKERTRLMGIANMVGQISWMIVPLFWVLIANKDLFDTQADGVRTLSVFVGFACLGFGILPAIFCKENDVSDANSKANLTLKDLVINMKILWNTMKNMTKNIPFMRLCGATFLVFNGFQMVASFSYFIIVFYMYKGSYEMAGTVPAIFSILGSFLTAIFLIAEITGGYELFVPLMIVALISFVVTQKFVPYNIYASELAKKGQLITHDKDKNVLMMLDLDKLIEKDFVLLHPEMTLGDVVNKAIAKSSRNHFPVVNEEMDYLGILTINDIRGIMFNKELYDTVKVESLMHAGSDIIYYEKDSAEDILNKFKRCGAWNLVVFKDGKYFGFISKSRLLTAYRRKLIDVTA